MNIDTANSGNAEEIRPKPLGSENGQNKIRNRSAEAIKKTGIVDVVDLEPGNPVRLQRNHHTVRSQMRVDSTPEAQYLPNGPGANPVDLNPVTHAVSYPSRMARAPGEKTDTHWPDASLLKDCREQIRQNTPALLDDDENTCQDRITRLFPGAVKRLPGPGLRMVKWAALPATTATCRRVRSQQAPCTLEQRFPLYLPNQSVGCSVRP